MKNFFLLLALCAQPVLACDPPAYFPCSVDDRRFSIAIDAIQSTLPKEVLALTTVEDGPDQWAKGKNVTDLPLYEITDQETAAVPMFTRDKKKWYVVRRYTKSEVDPTSCTPTSDLPLGKVGWACDEQRNTCGPLMNPNIVTMPREWPREWYANDPGQSTPPKKAEDHFVHYFLYKEQIEKVTLAATADVNDDYLKVTCDENAKIEACGAGCIAFVTDVAARKGSKTVRIKMRFETDTLPIDLEFSTVGKMDESRNTVIDLLSKNVVHVLDAAGDAAKLPMNYLMGLIAARVYAPINTELHRQPWQMQIQKRKK